MQVENLQTAGAALLKITGDLNVEAAEAFRAALAEAHHGGGATVLDLRPVTGIDLAGLQVLVSAIRSFLAAGLGLSLQYGEVVCEFCGDAGVELPPSSTQ